MKIVQKYFYKNKTDIMLSRHKVGTIRLANKRKRRSEVGFYGNPEQTVMCLC